MLDPEQFLKQRQQRQQQPQGLLDPEKFLAAGQQQKAQKKLDPTELMLEAAVAKSSPAAGRKTPQSFPDPPARPKDDPLPDPESFARPPGPKKPLPDPDDLVPRQKQAASPQVQADPDLMAIFGQAKPVKAAFPDPPADLPSAKAAGIEPPGRSPKIVLSDLKISLDATLIGTKSSAGTDSPKPRTLPDPEMFAAAKASDPSKAAPEGLTKKVTFQEPPDLPSKSKAAPNASSDAAKLPKLPNLKISLDKSMTGTKTSNEDSSQDVKNTLPDPSIFSAPPLAPTAATKTTDGNADQPTVVAKVPLPDLSELLPKAKAKAKSDAQNSLLQELKIKSEAEPGETRTTGIDPSQPIKTLSDPPTTIEASPDIKGSPPVIALLPAKVSKPQVAVATATLPDPSELLKVKAKAKAALIDELKSQAASPPEQSAPAEKVPDKPKPHGAEVLQEAQVTLADLPAAQRVEETGPQPPASKTALPDLTELLKKKTKTQLVSGEAGKAPEAPQEPDKEPDLAKAEVNHKSASQAADQAPQAPPPSVSAAKEASQSTEEKTQETQPDPSELPKKTKKTEVNKTLEAPLLEQLTTETPESVPRAVSAPVVRDAAPEHPSITEPAEPVKQAALTARELPDRAELFRSLKSDSKTITSDAAEAKRETLPEPERPPEKSREESAGAKAPLEPKKACESTVPAGATVEKANTDKTKAENEVEALQQTSKENTKLPEPAKTKTTSDEALQPPTPHVRTKTQQIEETTEKAKAPKAPEAVNIIPDTASTETQNLPRIVEFKSDPSHPEGMKEDFQSQHMARDYDGEPEEAGQLQVASSKSDYAPQPGLKQSYAPMPPRRHHPAAISSRLTPTPGYRASPTTVGPLPSLSASSRDLIVKMRANLAAYQPPAPEFDAYSEADDAGGSTTGGPVTIFAPSFGTTEPNYMYRPPQQHQVLPQQYQQQQMMMPAGIAQEVRARIAAQRASREVDSELKQELLRRQLEVDRLSQALDKVDRQNQQIKAYMVAALERGDTQTTELMQVMEEDRAVLRATRQENLELRSRVETDSRDIAGLESRISGLEQVLQSLQQENKRLGQQLQDTAARLDWQQQQQQQRDDTAVDLMRLRRDAANQRLRAEIGGPSQQPQPQSQQSQQPNGGSSTLTRLQRALQFQLPKPSQIQPLPSPQQQQQQTQVPTFLNLPRQRPTVGGGGAFGTTAVSSILQGYDALDSFRSRSADDSLATSGKRPVERGASSSLQDYMAARELGASARRYADDLIAKYQRELETGK